VYWMVIGVMSGVLGVPVDALAIVVATHELAHAYSHLGRDIDGSRWETEAFARAELNIAEGIAQFYTEMICHKLPGEVVRSCMIESRKTSITSYSVFESSLLASHARLAH
jgi:hypothetical protein